MTRFSIVLDITDGPDGRITSFFLTQADAPIYAAWQHNQDSEHHEQAALPKTSALRRPAKH